MLSSLIETPETGGMTIVFGVQLARGMAAFVALEREIKQHLREEVQKLGVI